MFCSVSSRGESCALSPSPITSKQKPTPQKDKQVLLEYSGTHSYSEPINNKLALDFTISYLKEKENSKYLNKLLRAMIIYQEITFAQNGFTSYSNPS